MKRKIDLKTKDRILKEAIEEFVEYGFYGARMQRIADRAAVNKAMLFYYFSSKDQIYREVLTQTFGPIIEGLNRIGGDPEPVKDKIRRIVDVYNGVFGERPEYTRLIQYELMTGGKHIKEVLKDRQIPFSPVNGSIYWYFKKKMDEGEIKQVDIFQLLGSILGQIVMPFMVYPMLRSLASAALKEFDLKKFLADRREFIAELVCNGIQQKKR
jgi:AcrR family transcriptional regulator